MVTATHVVRALPSPYQIKFASCSPCCAVLGRLPGRLELQVWSVPTAVRVLSRPLVRSFLADLVVPGDLSPLPGVTESLPPELEVQCHDLPSPGRPGLSRVTACRSPCQCCHGALAGPLTSGLSFENNQAHLSIVPPLPVPSIAIPGPASMASRHHNHDLWARPSNRPARGP